MTVEATAAVTTVTVYIAKMYQGTRSVSRAGIERKDGETCVDYIRSRHAAALPRAPGGVWILMRRDNQDMQNDGELLWLEDVTSGRGEVWWIGVR